VNSLRSDSTRFVVVSLRPIAHFDEVESGSEKEQSGVSGTQCPDNSFHLIAFSLSLVRFFLFTRNKEKEMNVTKIIRIQQL